MQSDLTNNLKADPVYNVWRTMRQRCSNPNNKSYRYYGGLGVTVCERWQSYAAFMEDMGPRPEGMTIDRINAKGNYEPGNCRWATRAEQTRNRSNAVLDEPRVSAMRHLLAAGVPQKLLVQAFGVGKSTVSMVAKRQIWD